MGSSFTRNRESQVELLVNGDPLQQFKSFVLIEFTHFGVDEFNERPRG